jgi:trehalose 6-phosphate phosphatase
MDAALQQALAPLRADPHRAGVICDIDGTLAPIVDDPAASRLEPGALEALEALTGRYALVGCVSGRAAADARRLVPLDGVELAGNHGLELVRDGRVEIAAEARPYLDAVRTACADAEADATLRELGCKVENKGVTFTVHYRTAPDREAARSHLEQVLRPRLEAAGLRVAFGRMVLEARPPVAVDKGSAVRRLRSGRGLSSLLYAGDDWTDLDAFREATVRVAVRSDEGPPELLAAADAVVDGCAQVVALLRHLS